MLLVEKLCPVETTIYPGFSSNKVEIGATDEPCTGKYMGNEPKQDDKRGTSSSTPRGFFDFDWIEEKREEVPREKMKSRCKRNRRARLELEGLAEFPDLSDSDVGLSFLFLQVGNI
jgi:hypothetical protein